MNTTLLVFCIALVLYVGSCARQWHRLQDPDDPDRDQGSRQGQ